MHPIRLTRSATCTGPDGQPIPPAAHRIEDVRDRLRDPAAARDILDHPALFVLLGPHCWTTTSHAAALHMDRAHGWTRWCLYPGDDPDEAIPRIPRAVHTHATMHCHPDGTWHLTWTRPTDPGALPVTAMRHPAAPATAAAVPNPDRGPRAAVWAH
ncbi:hypothetical protein [Streptomyces flaveolus]|uniref:hypothetical protein n=1 Tax=Streptomyces flaveolus TaxID=67297 RepID=UPI0036F5C546